MVSNSKRIPFVLNLDDPVDAAIWQALEPMLTRHRASQFIRGAVAHALGVGGMLTPAVTPTMPALPAGEQVRAKRPTPVQTIQDDPLPPDGDISLDDAAGNFLNMFG